MLKVAILGKEYTSTNLVQIAHIVLAIDDWMPIYAELISAQDDSVRNKIFKIILECDAVIVDDTVGNIAITCKSFVNYARKRQKHLHRIVGSSWTYGSIHLYDEVEKFLSTVAKKIEESNNAT